MLAGAATDDPLRFHGGRVAAAAARFPEAIDPWLDLSTGISPWAYPVGCIERHLWQRLPDPQELAELEAAAASAFGGVSAEQIVAVPGTDIAIRIIAQMLCADRIGIVGPTYGTYAETWPGARIGPYEKVRGSDLLICANPNNPNGAVIDKTQLQRLRNIRVVDEAFAEAQPKQSLLPHRNGAIVLRSFGKFYGLAGVRLGFVIADRPFAKELRGSLGDWPISGPAIAIGIKAYRDAEWQERQRERLCIAAQKLAILLEDNGLSIVGGTPLFQLASHSNVPSLFEHLACAGILTRPFTNNPDWLRFGIPGSEGAFDRLAAALQNWKHA